MSKDIIAEWLNLSSVKFIGAQKEIMKLKEKDKVSRGFSEIGFFYLHLGKRESL